MISKNWPKGDAYMNKKNSSPFFGNNRVFGEKRIFGKRSMVAPVPRLKAAVGVRGICISALPCVLPPIADARSTIATSQRKAEAA